MRKNLLMIVLFLLVLPFSFASLDTDLLGYWQYDSDGTDSSTNGNDATISGATNGASQGFIGNGYSTDGVDDYISLPISGSDYYTVSSMIQFKAFNSKSVWGRDSTSKREILLQAPSGASSGTMFVTHLDDSQSCITCSNTPARNWDSNTWYHLVMVVTPTSFDLYIDGVSFFSDTYSTATLPSTLTDFRIGDRISASFPATLYVDETAYWDRALTVQEISELNGLYNNSGGSPVYPFTSPAPELNYYDFTVRDLFNESFLEGATVSIINKTNVTDVNGLATIYVGDYDISLFLPLNNTDYTDETTAPYLYGSDGTLSGYSFNHGSLENGASVTSNGLELDGVSEFIDILNNDIFEMDKPFTISTWVSNNDDSGTSFNIFSMTNSSGYRVAFTTRFNNVRTVLFDGSSTITNEYGATGWTNQGLTQLTFVYNGSDFLIYNNGVYSVDGDASASSSGAVGTRIGSRTDNALYFKGNYSNFLIYNRGLSSTEVSELYNCTSGSNKFSCISDGLVFQQVYNTSYANSTDAYDVNNMVQNHDGTDLAYRFDGVSENIVLNNVDFRSPNSTWSIWYKRDSSSFEYIFNYYQNSLNRYGCYSDPSNKLICYDDLGNTNEGYNIGSIATPNEWHNLVVVFEEDGDKIFYHDGFYVDADQTGYNLTVLGVGVPFYIGSQTLTGNYFDGSLSDVLIFNKSLSADEVSDLYNQGAYTFVESKTNPTNAEYLVALNNYFNVSGTIATINTSTNVSMARYPRVEVTDRWDGQVLDDYNITVNSFVYQPDANNYTYLPYNNSALGITISKSGYATRNVTIDASAGNNISLEMWGSEVDISLTTKYGEQNIQTFTVKTEQGDFSTTNGTVYLYPNQATYNWNITTEQYFNLTDYEFVVDEVQESFIVENMSNSIITFVDGNTLVPFDNILINLSYPNGSLFQIYTNSTGSVEVSGQIIGSYNVFNLTFLDLGGYNTPITFPYNNSATVVETKEIKVTTININIYDYENNSLLYENTTVNILNYFSVSTDNGTIIIENATIVEGDVTIYASATGYLTTQKTFTYNDQQDINLDIYLKNANITTLGNLFTYTLTEDYYSIQNADTRLLKYFSDSGEFVEVEQCFTDANGECVFNILLGEELYIITSTATINGQEITARSSEQGNFFSVDNTEIELYLRESANYVAPDDFDLQVYTYNSTLINNISFYNGYFIDSTGNTHTVCLGYSYVDSGTTTEAYETCATGSSGTVGITGGQLLNRSYNWIASIYTEDASGNLIKEYARVYYPAEDSFKSTFSDFFYPFLAIITGVIIAVGIISGNIILAPIGLIGIGILVAILDPTIFSLTLAGVIIFFNLAIIWVARKKSDNEGI
jgi:hypothetical protein